MQSVNNDERGGEIERDDIGNNSETETEGGPVLDPPKNDPAPEPGSGEPQGQVRTYKGKGRPRIERSGSRGRPRKVYNRVNLPVAAGENENRENDREEEGFFDQEGEEITL